MSPFSTKIRHFVNEYKKVLRRHLAASTYTLKVKTLHIKRKELKYVSDVDLFHIANRILYDIETWLMKQNISACEYSGIEEFHRHLRDYLRDHHYDNDNILHCHQQASRAIVESIQLLCMPLNERTIALLKKNIVLMRKIGSSEHLDKLSAALYKKNTEMNNHFQPIIQFFENEQHNNH